ncbi:MAG TPA: choice-of-anchor tandem repeat GloVer-containing protein [Bryobacteraceae bacterium]|nr:choice-of-anchor tandem repeat GloVer-containing protein [Bryobacteraceae bacterium]
MSGLVQATNGDFYGTTVDGGANGDYGTVFRITPSGTLTTLYSFCSQTNCTDGTYPYAGLVQATNGDLYGTTSAGGAYGHGTVFKITQSGTVTTLHSFDGADGSDPFAGLIQATNGELYGTTLYGGDAYGTVFEMTASGRLTTLHSFGYADGAYPYARLVQGTDGNFYGTTSWGGANGNYGTAYKIAPSGTLTTLYSFCSQSGCTDGEEPDAALVQATNGDFYGTTVSGGASNWGTVFNLSVGLGPFVETLPSSGAVGSAVKILGSDLTGATSVSFDGTAAAFTVVSPSLITTTVPVGATTGEVHVVTPSRTLSSNVPFRVP